MSSSQNELIVNYSALHGYVVPDTEDGFDGLDVIDPTGLVPCPFVRIPYVEALHQCHCLEANLKKNKEKHDTNEGKGKNKSKEEEDGPVLKKVKLKEIGEVKQEQFEEQVDDEIDICNTVFGILCPKYKTMPEYRVPWPTFSRKMKETKRKEEIAKNMKKKEELE